MINRKPIFLGLTALEKKEYQFELKKVAKVESFLISLKKTNDKEFERVRRLSFAEQSNLAGV